MHSFQEVTPGMTACARSNATKLAINGLAVLLTGQSLARPVASEDDVEELRRARFELLPRVQ